MTVQKDPEVDFILKFLSDLSRQVKDGSVQVKTLRNTRSYKNAKEHTGTLSMALVYRLKGTEQGEKE